MNISGYVVITPVRNEENFLPCTIDSMAAQTLRPDQWIIVDDGSTDNTFTMACAAAKDHDWIRVIRRPDRGFRKPGGGVIESFYEAYREIASDDWQVLVKLDGDLTFSRDYFQRCLRHFENNSALGIGGGTISKLVGSTLVPEAPKDPPFHVRGATKLYRRECWDAIGGLIQAPGWDTVDEYKANMLGWLTFTFPDLTLWHHRPAGAAQGTWKNWVKNGLANYVAGYHPLFMLSKCLHRAFAKPYGVIALGLLVGFLSGYLKRLPQFEDREVIRFLRKQQMKKLLFRESLWDRKPELLL